ncbi:glutathione S-transferase N-terminal domain-containing protein [Variovorax sp. Sphag1AA]|uniref:glutathione S-transferase N-terminal domain-containing protein n=1 Tax=Variovorax sp. Sphag1AA TaxID=2587027 RepID=UPI00160D747D|nr:glutathione S-transferase N-terminal domain-containing protein [Variovorax sp. Sphag1AA]MBB3178378.1 glutathione S-transferase [Variovorax sp. Sphag1AA]
MQFLVNTTSPFGRIAHIAMIEKGLDVEPTLVDPWADDPRLRAANCATRVPTLVLDDGTPLTECPLIVQWLETTRPAPDWPGLLGPDAKSATAVVSRAGVALGAIDASVHTIITRKVTAPVLFDETPVGLRRRRSMIEGLERLEAVADILAGPKPGSAVPTLDTICAVVLYDYQQFRYGDQPWLPATPKLKALAEAMRVRPSFAKTMPRAA